MEERLCAIYRPSRHGATVANDRHSYVEFYPSDWTAGTAYMPASVEWLYLQVCLYNWDRREPLPQNQTAMRFSRSSSWEADLAMLIDAGKVIRTASGGLFVERAMIAANKAYDLWARKSRGGKNRHSGGNQGENGGGGQDSGNTPASSPASNQNQNQNQNQTPLDGESPPDPPAGDLVFAVPADAMKAFRDHRTKLKHPMTQRAEELLIAKLERIHADHGHDPSAVIDQSILNGWRGVFPIKDEGNGRSDRQGTGPRGNSGDGFSRAVDRRLGLD